MYKTISEQEWVYDYWKKTDKPLPIVLGTRGTWTGNGKPMIILIGFTVVDVFVLADLYGVAHHPVREVRFQGVTYFAINIIDRKRVREIIMEWRE